MRYRLRVNRSEYVALVVPLLDGAMKMYDRHGFAGWKLANWHAWVHQTPFLFVLIASVLIYLRHRYSYVDLTPSELEYRSLWRARTIQYCQIERILRGAPSLDKVGGGVTQIYANGIKRLDLKLEETAGFVAELRQYAPQAMFEGWS